MEKKDQKNIITVVKGSATSRPDWLAGECPLTISVNGRQYITLLATPDCQDELAVGFAMGEGLLKTREDICSLDVSNDGSHVDLKLRGNVDLAARLAATRVLTTGCGKGSGYFRAIDSLQHRPVTGGRTMDAQGVTNLMGEFAGRSTLFDETGAVHAAALAGEEIVVFREDVARHNAIDKLAGHAVLNDMDAGSLALVTSGRISSELVLKAARLEIGLLLSRSAPTSLAVELAEKLGMTVAGFIRGQRFNIYCNSWRLKGI